MCILPIYFQHATFTCLILYMWKSTFTFVQIVFTFKILLSELKCKGETGYYTCAPKGQTELICGVKYTEDKTCREGCYCPPGKALNGNRCVDLAQCPCIHNGKEIKPGASITQECYPCTCTNGVIKCFKVRDLTLILPPRYHVKI